MNYTNYQRISGDLILPKEFPQPPSNFHRSSFIPLITHQESHISNNLIQINNSLSLLSFNYFLIDFSIYVTPERQGLNNQKPGKLIFKLFIH